MNYLDIIILAVIGYFLYRGIRKGLVKTLSGIIGFFAALVIATSMMGTLADLLQNFLRFNKVFAYLFSYILLFFGVIILFKFVSSMLVKLFTITSTRWIDRAGGGFLGFLLGSLLVSSILIFLSYFTFTERLFPESDRSLLYPYVRKVFPVTYDVFSSVIPASKKYSEISEDILGGEPREALAKTQAGRDLLDYWDKINEKAREKLGVDKQ